MKLPRLPGRFEWKILAAMFIVASLPLGAAAYVMSVTLRLSQNATEGHQEAVRQALGGAVDVYKSYFAQMKENFRDRGNEIAAAHITRASELADVPDLLRARILEGDRVVDEWAQPPEVQERAHEAPPTLVALPPGPAGVDEPRILELTFGISREIYANFLALREATEKEHDLDRVLPLILPRIVRGLGIALLVVLALATLVGLGVARRATGRVAALRDAALRVGAGDLSVRVAPRGNDELDELARTFDVMVAELGDARSRLGYLQKVSAWQEVARRLAHEIKNPLTPIQLAVQELASKYRGDDPVYRRLLATAQEILNEEVGAIRRLVDDFSAFAKLPKVEPAPVDLSQVVEDFARAHPEWQEFLHVDRNGQVGALCDRMLLRNVLANLVENAVQAAEAAGRKPEIRIAVAPSAAERGARLTVDDNGPGVPEDARERIFDPYVTTKENGTGLGLAIVRKIVLDHGGDVHVDDQASPLGGARFVVTLPTAAGSRPTGPRAAAAEDRRR
ncbi:MAG TPA: ATP-binding protein [Polyangia bacterium]|jgi:nitrogen fixation/metabolism regulation signal transduction histidine kinase|nr:ATP-binding protein [Polyangia bacterium]